MFLAVDNDPRALRLMADYLGEHEMRVTALPSGRAIADAMASEMIDVVVLDVPLPGGRRAAYRAQPA